MKRWSGIIPIKVPNCGLLRLLTYPSDTNNLWRSVYKVCELCIFQGCIYSWKLYYSPPPPNVMFTPSVFANVYYPQFFCRICIIFSFHCPFPYISTFVLILSQVVLFSSPFLNISLVLYSYSPPFPRRGEYCIFPPMNIIGTLVICSAPKTRSKLKLRKQLLLLTSVWLAKRNK
jgi:hypothetical protein